MKFYKYHGAGNDFILFDGREKQINLSQQIIQKICHRRFGIGADGIMILKNHISYDFEMDYYNSDGSGGTMCGNGGRCIVAFAKKLNIIENYTEFLASDGMHEAYINENKSVKLKMADVSQYKETGSDYTCYTGSPHYIRFEDNITNKDVFSEGKKIRYSELYKNEGINVNFVKIENTHTLSIRTYERGVEEETLACGTGSVAAAIIHAERNNMISGEITLKAPGGILYVSFEKNGGVYKNIWLSGAAEFVFEGKVNPDLIGIVHPFVKGLNVSKENKNPYTKVTNIIPEYRRNLPHFQPKDGVFFITFRLHGTLPKDITEKIRDNYELEIIKCKNQTEKNEIHREYFEEYDSILDSSEISGNLLKENKNAEIVKEAIHYRDGKDYQLICYTIMSNHVHLIFYKAEKQVFKILGSLKRHTSRQINILNNTTGVKVWQKESYDNLIKNRNDLANKIKYVINNPVKAGLTDNWENWKFTYCKKEFMSKS
jgi:diaminopimelate epimerase